MTDLELYSVFLQSASSAEDLVQNFTTVLFGFLIASYLVSDRLDRVMVSIVLSLYSVMALRYAFVYINASDDVIAMATELRALAAMPGSSIYWLEIGPVYIFYNVVFLVMIFSYLASLVFFFRTRRNPRKRSKDSSPLGGI